jgi:hypothetical protein
VTKRMYQPLPEVPPERPEVFADLLAKAMRDQQEAERLRTRYEAARTIVRDSFQACFAEYGSPRPHTDASRGFWRRWHAAESEARQ